MFSSNTSQVSNDAVFVEDVFSTWLYTGNGSTQTITNGIDLAGKGGMTWIKYRNSADYGTHVYDTVRGINRSLRTNSTAAQNLLTDTFTAFNSNGFSLGNNNDALNFSGGLYASWTFRKAPKFFDVVTYTGDGTANRSVSHSLGSTPGCIIVKQTNTTRSWFVFHRSLANGGTTEELSLNSTAAASGNGYFPAVSSTTFSVSASSAVNQSGGTYIAYLFAHNAGGFGLTGTDNVISCGSFSSGSPGNNTTVNLGYEPQWIIFKNTQNGSEGWWMYDTMRGWTGSLGTAGDKYLFSNSSGAEGSITNYINVTSTGFVMQGGAFATDQTFIYIAIRRGPMKTPTSGTSVFSPNAVTSSSSNTIVDAGFPIDLSILKIRNAVDSPSWFDRLRGITASSNPALRSPSTAAEVSTTDLQNAGQTTVQVGPIGTYNDILWNFRRAPGFFDEVCYTGDSTAGRQVTHNLGVPPEFLIVKRRSGADSWYCYAQPLGNTYDLLLDSTRAARNADDIWYSTSPTSTNFTVRQYDAVNGSGQTYVAYLFASCPGVQSIQSYVGDGTTGRTINCGFTGGARFVCIKATSTTGSWWTFDSARGIVTNNDPALQLNSTAAEVTSADAIDTAASGFIVNQEATCSLNASGVTYLVWAIA